MINAYHQARQPAQPPPPSGNAMHSYIHYATNPALRPPTRQQHQMGPTRPGPLIPFFTDTVGTLCAQLYSAPPSVGGFPVPLMYSGGTGTSDTGRAQPPPPFTWTNPGQPSVTIMTAQPQAAQPNPQQQPQAQPSPYQQGQFTYVQPRMHSYTAAGGGGAAAGAAGMQQAPPNALLVDNRTMTPLQVHTQSKNKSNRKNRIPIIHPLTGMEVEIEDKNVGAGGAGGGGIHVHPDHTGSGGQHPHMQHSSSQISSAVNAHVAADFAKQVAQVAMNNETPSSRPPREEEPQVNGPASVALGSSPAVLVEESTTPAPTNKRPPGLTPVVSAQAEGTTYDIQSIRSSSSRNVEIRSGESSPARSKATSQSSPSPVAQILSQSEVTHAPPVVTAPPPPPQIISSPIQIQEQQQQQIQVAAEPPKQQRRPRGPVSDSKEKLTQPSKPLIVQVEEKIEDDGRNRTSSGSSRTLVSKEKEFVKQVSTPIIKTTAPTKPTPSEPIPSSKLSDVEDDSDLKVQFGSSLSDLSKYDESMKKSKLKRNQTSIEKPSEKAASEPALVIEKQVKPVTATTDAPRLAKISQEKNVVPTPSTTPVVTSVAPKIKTTFALDISLENMKVTAKAATVALTVQQQQSSAATEHSSDQPESSHPQVKAVSRTKQKMKPKMRDINQKGNEKEGTPELDSIADIRPVSTQPSPLSLHTDNNNRTTPTNDNNKQTLANKQQNTEISNRTVTQDSNKDNRNSVDNALRPSDATTRLDSNITNDRDKSPAATEADATNNNNINNQIAQQFDEDTDANDIVAAKNEENMKKSNSSLTDSNSTDSSQVISAPPPSSQPSLKYQYKDDQWSPVNPQGKKVYDRDFLMKLRMDPLSSKKPNIMPDLEIIKSRDAAPSGATADARRTGSHSSYGVSGFSGSMRCSNGLFPDFNRTLSQRMAPKRSSQTGGGNRGPGGGGGGRSLKMFNNSASLRDDYKLNQCENAWKPAKLTGRLDSKTKEEREVADLYKKVRGILNKLTPQKFDTLLEQFQSLPFTTLERLQGTIKLVFEKALDEPAFSVSYANLCKVLARLQVVDQSAAAAEQAAQQTGSDQQKPAQQPQPVNFRKILITRCQQEFETNKKLELDFEQKQLEINECPDPEKRKELQLLFNEEERKIRMKSVGLVTFIGELFKLKMLTVNIMHGCIKQLLEKIDEESLECLCKLLTTIGKEFEEQISKNSNSNSNSNSNTISGIEEFNNYFNQMAKLSKKHEKSKVSSRVRFMLQDVIELRQNKWVPRRDENKPKTMAQIQEEVKRETEKAAILSAQPMRPMSQNMNQDRNQRRNNVRGSNQNDDGWSIVSKYNSRNTLPTESNKIQGLKSAAGQELESGSRDISLAPAQSLNKWVDGAGASGSSSNRRGHSSNFADCNMYSVLEIDKKTGGVQGSKTIYKSQMSDEKEKEKDKELMLEKLSSGFYRENSFRNDDSKERDGSRGRLGTAGGSPSPSLSGPLRKPQEFQKRPTEGGRSESSRESTPSSQPVSTMDKKQSREPPQEVELTDKEREDLTRVTDCIIQEYISLQNLDDSIINYKERYKSNKESELFVSTSLQFILDQFKEDTRIKVSRLLGELTVRQVCPLPILMSELEKLFECVADLKVDVPHIWNYLGEIFGELIMIEALDFGHLKQAVEVVVNSSTENEIHVMLKEIFKTLLFEKVPGWAKEKWDSSKIQLSDLIKDQKILDAFKAEYLPFFEGKEVTSRESSIPFDKVQQKLLSFLKSSTYQYEEICNWLALNVGKSVSDPMFIRPLTEAVIRSSLNDDENGSTPRLDKNLLHRNTDLIRRYVDNKEKLELECLYTVQHLVVISLECPKGMLVEIFQELYESTAISLEGFNKWRQVESLPVGWQKEGRGVAIASSNSFFIQMEQDENDDYDQPS